MQLQQILLPYRESHRAINNPELTRDAQYLEKPSLDLVLEKGTLSPEEKMLHVEAVLLAEWEFSGSWKRYLDSPLIAHIDAALRLRALDYNAVVGIKKAGVPYADIFRIAGYPVFGIEYSHHKRKLKEPTIDEESLKELEGKIVLLTDVDFVTGKTLTTVYEFLKSRGINVGGAYIGLSEWPGVDSKNFSIGENTIDFEKFWQGNQNGLSWLRSRVPHNRKIIPRDLRIFGANSNLANKEKFAATAARRIAKFLLKKNE